MGTESWGQVTVPQWALRFKVVKLLIDQYDSDGFSDGRFEIIGAYQFASPNFVRNDEFPQPLHQILQDLQIPYDYSFALAMNDGGTRAGGWRPGMRAPLEYLTVDGERVFTQGELRDILAARVPVAVRLARIAALVQQTDEQLPPVGRWPDPRAVQAQTLRSSGTPRTSSRPPRRPRRL